VQVRQARPGVGPRSSRRNIEVLGLPGVGFAPAGGAVNTAL